MKIAVYAIAKNEEAFVERCLGSCADADEIVVCDTGSTDATWDRLHRWRETNVELHRILVDPWRFDTARNTALALVNADVDVCVPLDLDEVLTDGWRSHLEKAWTEGTTRLRYGFVWSWQKDGSPGVSFQQDKIHARRGYFWKGLVHEVITPDARTTEVWAETSERLLEHHPDDSKSRGQYLDLLRIAVNENPQDDRMMHYYGRELMFVGRNADAIGVFLRHLDLKTAHWRPERAASMRYLSTCYARQGMGNEALLWARRACAECPDMREPWVALAQLAHDRHEWAECYSAAMKALAITERPQIYINWPEAWGVLPHDLAGTSAFYIGLHEEALEHTLLARELDPDNVRIKDNCELISQTLSHQE